MYVEIMHGIHCSYHKIRSTIPTENATPTINSTRFLLIRFISSSSFSTAERVVFFLIFMPAIVFCYLLVSDSSSFVTHIENNIRMKTSSVFVQTHQCLKMSAASSAAALYR